MSVSIVMALYNAADDLPECLASIADVAPGIPLVIQDGGSTDKTLEVLNNHSAGAAAEVVSEPDKGIYDALNKAIARVKTDYVYILGADDRLLPGWQTIAGKLKESQGLVYGQVELMSAGSLHAGEFDAAKLARTNICQQAVFYPTELLKKHPFDLRFPLQADWALHMACWSDGTADFHYKPDAVCRYNDQSGVSSRIYDSAFVEAYPGLLWRHFPKPYFFRYGIAAWLAHRTRGLRGKGEGH